MTSRWKGKKKDRNARPDGHHGRYVYGYLFGLFFILVLLGEMSAVRELLRNKKYKGISAAIARQQPMGQQQG